jgi:hypothetical protein
MAGCRFAEKCIVSINGPSHSCEIPVSMLSVYVLFMSLKATGFFRTPDDA